MEASLDSRLAPEKRLAANLSDAREKLMEVSKLADECGGNGTRNHALNAVAHIDDALTALSDGIPR